MTPDEWDNANDPLQMLQLLRDHGRLTDRKARLFCVAVCRQSSAYLTDERSRGAIAVSERYADGLATKKDLRRAANAAWDAAEGPPGKFEPSVRQAMWATVGAAFPDACTAVERVLGVADERPAKSYCALLRDLFSPFHAAALDPSCLTPPVVSLAQAIYDERSFERLPELARALADAGCTDAGLLAHLRSPGPHIRGCHALDAVLGRS
jgi:hypothetical protein